MNKKKIPRRLDPGRDGDRHRDRLHDLRQLPDKKAATQVAGYISIMSDVFLRLIKMLIGPWSSTLVVGIAHMGDAASVGRVFAKALGWFVIASLFSLVLGLIMATGCSRATTSDCRCPTSARRPTWRRPSSRSRISSAIWCLSFAEAMANNEILQIVVFSMFFGAALAALGEKGKTLVAAVDELAHVMLKITGYVMKLAPLAVMAAMAATVAVNGWASC